MNTSPDFSFCQWFQKQPKKHKSRKYTLLLNKMTAGYPVMLDQFTTALISSL